MSRAQFVFPKMRLAAQLKEAGGVAVGDAMEAAQTNLVELRPEGLIELQGIIAEVETCFSRMPAGGDAETLQAVYAAAARGVGLGDLCGARAADAALVSLCDLIDQFQSNGSWDRDAIGVHVGTLKLLAAGTDAAMPQAAIDQLLMGLRKVTARYSTPKAAAAS